MGDLTHLTYVMRLILAQGFQREETIDNCLLVADLTHLTYVMRLTWLKDFSKKRQRTTAYSLLTRGRPDTSYLYYARLYSGLGRGA